MKDDNLFNIYIFKEGRLPKVLGGNSNEEGTKTKEKRNEGRPRPEDAVRKERRRRRDEKEITNVHFIFKENQRHVGKKEEG